MWYNEIKEHILKEVEIMKKIVLTFVLIGILSVFGFTVGELSIDSFPDQASVFVDNKYYGKTPLLVKNINDGVHEVMIIKAGERSFVENVYVYASDRTKVMADFTAASKYTNKSSQLVQQDADPAVRDTYVPEQRDDAAWRRERSKVRMRNTVLGLGLVNEFLGKRGSSRSKTRKVLGGLGILNEVGVFNSLFAPR